MGTNKRCCDAEIAIGACDANGSRRRVLSSLRRRQLQWTSQSNMVHSIKPWHVADSTHPWRMLTAIGSENIGDVRGRARDFLNVFNHMSQRRNHQKIEPLDITSNRCTHSLTCVCVRALGGVRVVPFGRCVFACAVCVAGADLWMHRLWGAAERRGGLWTSYVSTLTGN